MTPFTSPSPDAATSERPLRRPNSPRQSDPEFVELLYQTYMQCKSSNDCSDAAAAGDIYDKVWDHYVHEKRRQAENAAAVAEAAESASYTASAPIAPPSTPIAPPSAPPTAASPPSPRSLLQVDPSTTTSSTTMSTTTSPPTENEIYGLHLIANMRKHLRRKGSSTSF